jgi:hypothetical protein
VLRIRVLAALLCAAVDAAEWTLALTAARQLTPLYELVYPQVFLVSGVKGRGSGVAHVLFHALKDGSYVGHTDAIDEGWMTKRLGLGLLYRWDCMAAMMYHCLPHVLPSLWVCSAPLHPLPCMLQVWPNLGLHYALLAKLKMLLEQPAAAAEAAEQALAVLRVTHGGSSSVLQEVGRTRYEAGTELAAAAYRLAE